MDRLSRRQLLVAASACAACVCLNGPATAWAKEENAKTPVDVGPLAGYDKEGVWDSFRKQEILMVRQGNRLHALSAVCTHKRRILQLDGKRRVICSGHGSVFAPTGVVEEGPAKEALDRYGISVNEQGNVVVDRSVRYKEADWGDSGSFVVIPAA